MKTFLALGGWIYGSNNEDLSKRPCLFFSGKKPTLGALKLGPAPYRVKIKLLKTEGLQHAKEQASAHGFNTKKDNSNQPPEPDI